MSKSELALEAINKVDVEIIGVNPTLHIYRQLDQKFIIIFATHRPVFIVAPSVFKELFKVLYDFRVHWLPVVHLFQTIEEAFK
jgi:hypothetical protein